MCECLISVDNGMASAMVILCGRYIGGGEEEPSQQLLPCLPTNILFYKIGIFAFFFLSSISNCGNFLKEKCRKSSMCAALQSMMWLKSREVQSEGLLKVFFTHNQPRQSRF